MLGVILGSGATSRIYKSVVIDQKLASYAGAGYGGTALGDTQFVVYGAPADGKTNDQVLAAITAEIEKLIKDGVSDEEMRLAKKSLISDAFFAQDSQTSLARIFGSELATGATIESIQTWPSRVEAVTKDRVIAAARKYLLSPDAVTGYLLPAAASEKS